MSDANLAYFVIFATSNCVKYQIYAIGNIVFFVSLLLVYLDNLPMSATDAFSERRDIQRDEKIKYTLDYSHFKNNISLYFSAVYLRKHK